MRRDQIRNVVENALNNTPKNATQYERIGAIVEGIIKLQAEHEELRKKVADGNKRRIRERRILPELKGRKLHDFKNEFNTIFQTLGYLKFEDVMQSALQDMCLNFAVWGANNLGGMGEISPEEGAKMDPKIIKDPSKMTEKQLREEIFLKVRENLKKYANYYNINEFPVFEKTPKIVGDDGVEFPFDQIRLSDITKGVSISKRNNRISPIRSTLTMTRSELEQLYKFLYNG